MKIRKVIDICVKTGSVDLRTGADTDCQWIGNGAAFYAFYGLPHLTADNVISVFDIPEECANMIRMNGVAPLMLCENYRGEVACERDMVASRYAPDGLIPFHTSEGLVFIEQKYLQPFGKDKQLFFFERGGYIAVKEGITLRAVIAPKMVITREYIDGLTDYLLKCEITAHNILSARDPEQIDLNDETEDENENN